MSWDLHEASWKGFTFHVQSVDDAWSRRVVEYQYPGRAGADLDDLEREPLKFSFRAVFLGSTYKSDLKTLERLFGEGTSGPLVHPVHGTIQAAAVRMRVHHDHDHANFAEVDLEFVEDQLDQAAFSVVTDTVATAANKARATVAAATTALTALFEGG